MPESPDAGGRDLSEAQNASAYLRLPLPVVTAVLVCFLALLLGLGLYANANLRPRSVLVPTEPPTQLPAAASAATPQPAATPLPTATLQPSATPQPVATSTAVPAVVPSTPTPAAPATPLVIPPLAAATATGVPTAATSPTPLATVEPALAAEVGQAYENFWKVRSQAELTLDGSHAADVMANGYLDRFLQSLSDLENQGRAVKTHVLLNYTVVQVDGDIAFVHDYITDNSFYVDPSNDQSLGDPSDDMYAIEFKLTKSEGIWKVVDGVTQQ